MAPRGLISVHSRSLLLQVNSPSAIQTIPPALWRGPGYRYPVSSGFCRLGKDTVIDAETISKSVEAFFEIIDNKNASLGAEKKPTIVESIVYGGGFSEPLFSINDVIESMVAIRKIKPGAQLVLQTSGIGPSASSSLSSAAEEIVRLNDEFLSASGSDGDANFSVWINVGGSNPKEYQNIMAPSSPKKDIAFQECVEFVTNLAENNVRTIATASNVPGLNLQRVGQMAKGLGCKDFFTRSFHDKSLYAVLELAKDADQQTIRKKYLEMVRIYHPDVYVGDGNPHIMMSEISEANEVLGCAERRKLYDEEWVADLLINAEETDVFNRVVHKSM